MADLRGLQEKRRVCRGRYTKYEKTVQDSIAGVKRVLDEEQQDNQQLNLRVRKMITAMEELNKVYGELRNVQDEIEFHPTASEWDADTVERETQDEEKYRLSYLDTSAQVDQLRDVMNRRSPSKESHSSRETFSPQQFAECFSEALGKVNNGISGDQLEKILSSLNQKKRNIQIPKFKGDPELFDQWRELIESEVEKPGYSEVEKAHLVISLVDGEVAKLISGLKEPTYEDLMDYLENRYGDILARMELAINEIAGIAPVSSPTVKDLDPLYNKLVANWNYITKRTKDDPNLIQTSWMLTALVRPKLPKSLVKRWDGERIKEERGDDREPSNLPMTFDVLLEKLQDAVRVARRAEPVKKYEREPKKEQKKDVPFKSKPSGHALAVAEKSKPRSKYRDCCIFCGGSHFSYACFKVKDMSIDDRCQRVKESKACFNCLQTSHFVESCKASHCKICNRNHHTLLHIDRRGETWEKRDTRPRGDSSTKERDASRNSVEVVQSSTNLVKAVAKHDVVMQSGIAKIESKSAVTCGRVMFDSGSGVNFVSTKLAKSLQLRGKKVTGEFCLAGGKSMTLETERVTFLLSSALPEWKGETFEIEAYVIEKPSASLNKIELDLSRMPHLRRLQLADTFPRHHEAEVDVMLGIEDTINIMLDERVKGPRGCPIAQRSHIGWIVSGPYPEAGEGEKLRHSVNTCLSLHVQDETEYAKRHWDVEHIGILPSEKANKLTELEKEAVKQHTEKTSLEGDRYTTGLLKHPDWKDRNLKSNRKSAEKRLVGLEHRLRKDESLAKAYEGEIHTLLKNDHAEKIDEEFEPQDRTVWYLPHHPVLRPDKVTTKVRVVFDGSMKGPEGFSLNDTLLPGPALQPDLPGVLFRFRRHKVAIVSDVEKMFLQVNMDENDRDSMRFLWRNLDQSRNPEVYRLKTVTFGLTPSPFTCIKTVHDHVETLKDEYPKAVEEIRDNMFVDDVITGADTVAEASQLSVDLKKSLRLGGWRLCKFLSNKPEALSQLDKEDLASHVTAKMVGDESTKTLGVKYDPGDDVLMFSFYEKMDTVEQETRRTVLRQLHRIYDPLGMVAPFTLRAKQIFQHTWIAGGGWDDPIPEKLEQEWIKWKDEVATLDAIRVQRCIVPEHFVDPIFSLHGFGDASEASYGAVVYLLVEDSKTPEVHTAVLCSKTRVSPLGKKRTLPELELMASLITARLVRYVEREIKLPCKKITCWTDSRVVLRWISQPAYTWQTFVSNRVSEIQDLVEPSCWRHIPGRINPADLCSRGISAQSLVESTLWWDGPPFLREGESAWPVQESASDSKTEKIANEKIKPKLVNVLHVTEKTENVDPLLEYAERFSSHDKFIRVMSRVRSWVKRHREKRDQKSVGDEGRTEISLRDWRNEELFWIKWAQARAFSEEIENVKQGQPLSKQSKLIHLNPIWDEKSQVLRVGGRLHYAKLPDEVRNPMILPTHDPFVENLVLHYHRLYLHTGPAQTLACIRHRYWLVHGRQETRRILHKCRICREPIPMKQQMGPLPPERTDVQPAFTNVGVDFAGPLYVRELKVENKKVYICLFTCMLSRAIHLELVQDLSTETFLLALKRMISRRGMCAVIYSDNAKTFKKAASILGRIFKTPENMRDKLQNLGIEWRFITERAPWQGGFYERMVRSVKTTLRRVLGNSKLTAVELETVLIEVEAQINSRPISAISGDSEDPTPLTPGHLTIGRVPILLPDVDKETKSESLGKRWSHQQRLSKLFWNRWSKEYLLELNYLKKWENIRENVKKGDVVLITEDGQRRQDWLMGRVEEVHPGRDGLVRSVTVKTKRGLRRRPVQRLRLLEGAEM